MSDTLIQVHSVYIKASAEVVWEAVTQAPTLAPEVAGGNDPGRGGGGWPWVLSGLKTLLETGQVM